MGKKDRKKTTQEDKVAERRAKVALLLCNGASQRQIAETLDMGLGTVNRDVQALRLEWADQRADVKFQLDLDIRRTDEMLASVYRFAVQGNADMIHLSLRLMDQRARYLGLYDQNPIRHRFVDKDDRDIPVAATTMVVIQPPIPDGMKDDDSNRR